MQVMSYLHAHSPPFPADLLARVDELNLVAGDGCSQLVQGVGADSGAHVLHTPNAVRLSIFSDGIQVLPSL